MFNLVTIFAIFAGINIIATTLNHIDDTDETYGYWEPVHYLLYGTTGMQTWEYDVQYAIRTYAFLFPIFVQSSIFRIIVGVKSKLSVFLFIRFVLCTSFAYSEARFVNACQKIFGSSVGRNALLFLTLSPGVFFCSSAFLPSAVSASLVMLSFSFWMENNFSIAIAVGCIAVFWTGWPFVGVIFAPIGLHMIYTTLLGDDSRGADLIAVLSLLIRGIVILLIIAIPASAIDFLTYNHWSALFPLSLSIRINYCISLQGESDGQHPPLQCAGRQRR